ncbi:DUF488 family protein [Roseomonas chloroacetimidivorans]|jgi:uncharacterized protein (DUF488 family)|uniref:DUF488 domain-containing protein n=1 Tax=Roseomonas chloroacetimidivorans TaxID=1766656 RepID=UPI003C74CFCF
MSGIGELLTTGYEGATQDAVLARLQGAGVQLLIDVRAIPQSRKPGFSKRLLGASLEAAGIGYLHLRDLGTPKPGREAARAGDAAGLDRIFRAHMETAPAQAALTEAMERAGRQRACLLCFEADHRFCHRRILAEMICERTGQAVVHL